MPVYTYKCKSCGSLQDEVHASNITTKEYSKKLACSSCKEEGKMVWSPTKLNFGTYESSTPEQRKEILKKRSHEHFKKNIEEKFHELNRKKTT